jgi:amidophosphoribosyltransferase
VIAKKRLETHSIEQAVKLMLDVIEGAYSIVIMSPTKMIAVRDKHGIRPLSIGKRDGAYFFASETVAFDAADVEFVRDVKPGEVVYVDNGELFSIEGNEHCDGKTCIFEYIYFARPDSVIDGASVYESRKEAGKYLAREYPVEADVVFGVPDSGISAAIGYSIESKIPYEYGFIKNRYIARTFIQPTQLMRENAVKIKLNVQKSVVAGKRVVMVDDSIVRGTTSKRIVTLLKEAGAKEVHVRISSPPFLNPCYFGTDISSREHLIAVKYTIEEIRQMIGCDSLGFLSVENTYKIPIDAKCGFCAGCFTGEYPMHVPEEEMEEYNISDFITEISAK